MASKAAANTALDWFFERIAVLRRFAGSTMIAARGRARTFTAA
jgi:hypothetical protein